MLKTRERYEYYQTQPEPTLMHPTPATQAYYDQIGHPEWGTPDYCPPRFVSFTQNLRELIRSEEHGHHKWNECEHYKCFFEPLEGNNAVFEWICPTFETPSRWWTGQGLTKGLVSTVYDYMNPSLLGPVLLQPREDGGFVPPPPGLNSLLQRSLNAMMPQVKANLSLINSIIELKDFRSLPKTIRAIQGLPQKIIEGVKTFDKSLKAFNSLRKSSKLRRSFGTSGSTLREVMRTGADGYLQAQFNLSPLVSDISGLFATVLDTEKVIRNLINRQGIPQRRHFTYRWQPYKIESPLTEQVFASDDLTFHTSGGEVLYVGPAYVMETTSYIKPSYATFHAEMTYNYNYTALQREHALLFGILDSLGVNLNPAIIWNAIPWTFIVDWVFGISQWLDNRKVLNMRPEINITNFLWSWSYYRETRRIISGDNFRNGGFGPLKLPTVRESIYRRSVQLPDRSSLVLSGLSSREVSLGVALAITRGKRRYRRG